MHRASFFFFRPRPVYAAAIAAAALAPALAQQGASAPAYDLPAQPLNATVARIAGESGARISVDAELARGVTAAPVRGSLTPEAALQQALAGTGLELVRTGSGVLTVRRAAATATSGPEATSLREVTVTAEAFRSRATENTDSYTAQAVAAGSKLEQPLKDIPRSISVISREQMDDQRITQLDDALAQLPGVTFSPQTGGWGDNSYSTRSYSLTGITVDGSPTKNFFTGGGDSSVNTGLAKYDSVQLVRGPEGLFTGNGSPGGSINLVRKRPTDGYQLKTALSAGSWSNYLGTVDVSSPLNESASLRGRAVASYNDTEKFYENSQRKYTTLYGIVEADLAPGSILSAGASYDQAGGTGQDSAPDFPRYSNGGVLPIPRSAGFPRWSERNSESTNVFAGLEHRFDAQWSGRLNLSYTHARGTTLAAWFYGATDPLTGLGSQLWAPTPNDWNSNALAADFSLRGDTEIWGHRYKLVAGGDFVRTKINYARAKMRQATYPGAVASSFLALPRWEDFDAGQSGLVDTGPVNVVSNDETTQHGLYIYNSLQVAGPLRLIVGGRLASFENTTVQDNFFDYVNHSVTRTDRKNRNIFTPYYALQYDLGKQWTSFLTLARGYEDQSNLYTPERDPLSPTRSRSVEFGIKGEHFGGRLNTQFTFYRTRRENYQVQLYGDTAWNDANPGRTCCYAGDGASSARASSSTSAVNCSPGGRPTWAIPTTTA